MALLLSSRRLLTGLFALLWTLHLKVKGISGEAVCSRDEVARGTCSFPQVPADDSVMASCGLFMATSSIPHAGLGSFTGPSREIGDELERGEICVPLIDWYLNHGKPIRPGNNPFHDYYWDGDSIGMYGETPRASIDGMCFGLGCVANYHLALLNVKKIPEPEYNYLGLERTKDPGAGAFTPYHQVSSKASKPIPAGAEVFKNYGENWFKARKRRFKEVPLSKDFKNTLNALTTFVNKTLQQLEPDQQEGAFQTFRDFMTAPFLSNNYRLLNSTVPNTLDNARLAVEGKDMGLAFLEHSIRSKEELYNPDKARCIDNLQSGVSSIPQAGRGAFSRHHFSPGQIVTSSPVLHLSNKHSLHMYPRWITGISHVEIRKLVRSTYKKLHATLGYPAFMLVGQQPMVNYCWGHEKSLLLLCPYSGLSGLINHSSEKPNVAIRWARSFEPGHTHEVIERWTLAEMGATKNPLVSFEYVAIREIQPGEEILIDYGPSWEAAWKEHVDNFKPSKYVATAEHWNDMENPDNEIVRTKDERKEAPYPSNVNIRCHVNVTRENSTDYTWTRRDPGEFCYVKERSSDDIHADYTVRMMLRQKEPQWKTFTGVPREAIRFFDEPYTTEIHLRNAFRREMELPHALFPAQWCSVDEMEQFSFGFIVILLLFAYECKQRFGGKKNETNTKPSEDFLKETAREGQGTAREDDTKTNTSSVKDE